MTSQLTFHNHKFSIVTHCNQIWLTAADVASALEYADDKSVLRIHSRHADEFTDGMASVVNLTTRGVQRENRIFSLRGAHLIAMFARTPVAKEFRRWVLDVLDKQVGDPVVQPAPTYPPFSADHANRSEIIYYQNFKPIFCRVLRPEETVLTHESMKEWLEMQGLVFFTREEIKNWTVGRLLDIVK